MARASIDRMLKTLDVRLGGLSVINIAPGAQAVFEPAASITLHHPIAGHGVFKVGSGRSASMSAGEIVIAPGGLPFAVVAGGVPAAATPPRVMLLEDGAAIEPAAPRGDGLRLMSLVIHSTFGGALPLFEGMSEAIVDRLENAPSVSDALALVLAERLAPDTGSEALVETASKLALVLLIRRRLSSGGALSPLFAAFGDQRLAGVVGQVVNEPGARLSLAELAKSAGMSRSSFAKAFSAALGQTPMEFVQRTRLERAAQLLISTDLPIKALASDLGFGSRSHFSRAFRLAYEMDPTAFRAQRNAPPACD